MALSDQELLRQHHQGDSAAFTELTGRHINWLYSVALRRARDPHLAEDITQSTLLALATSPSARRAKVLSAWLFAVLRYTTAKAIRSESRRRRHEAAAAHQDIQPHSSMNTETGWQSLAPHLEPAVGSLRASDREAILLRFYQQLSFADMAKALNITEEAARKRATRAVARLRACFTTQKLTLTTEAFAIVIFDHCTRPAPPISSSASALAKSLHRAWGSHRRFARAAQLTGLIATIAIAGSVAILLSSNSAAQNAPMTQPVATNPNSTVPADSATRPSTLTFDQVIASIRQTEEAFQNVHVKNFLTTTETRDANETEWKPYDVRYAGSAWFGPVPDGPERLYLTDEVDPWINGTAPYLERLKDESWDGKEYRELTLASGPPHDVTRIVTAMISSQRSLDLNAYTRQWAGLGFTAQYYLMGKELSSEPRPRPTLSELLVTSSKVAGIPDVWLQTVNGLDAVRLHYSRIVPGKVMADFSYWFAPSRGFAFVKEEESLVKGRFSRKLNTDVREFKQVGANLWFPIRVVWTSELGPKEGQYERYTATISEVTVNDPAFDNFIFTAKIPRGWLVDDQRTSNRRIYLKMLDGSEYEIRPHKAIPFVRPDPATRPDGDDPPIVHSRSFGL